MKSFVLNLTSGSAGDGIYSSSSILIFWAMTGRERRVVEINRSPILLCWGSRAPRVHWCRMVLVLFESLDATLQFAHKACNRISHQRHIYGIAEILRRLLMQQELNSESDILASAHLSDTLSFLLSTCLNRHLSVPQPLLEHAPHTDNKVNA